MKKLSTINLEQWFVRKSTPPFVAALCNAQYTFEVVKETEKAIQIKIENTKKITYSEWLQWIPKSAILNLDTVLN